MEFRFEALPAVAPATMRRLLELSGRGSKGAKDTIRRHHCRPAQTATTYGLHQLVVQVRCVWN